MGGSIQRVVFRFSQSKQMPLIVSQGGGHGAMSKVHYHTQKCNHFPSFLCQFCSCLPNFYFRYSSVGLRTGTTGVKTVVVGLRLLRFVL